MRVEVRVTPENQRPRFIEVIDAPSNLGLRPPPRSGARSGPPPAGTASPGHCRAPRCRRWRIGDSAALLAGVVSQATARATPRPSAPIPWISPRRSGGVEAGRFPVILGGDCSIVLGSSMLRRRGQFGLAYIDGHLDFRHPGNAAHVEAAAGEDHASSRVGEPTG